MRVRERADILTAEAAFQSVLAAYHPRVGRAILRAWELAPELASAVGDHQSCSLEAPNPPTLIEIVAVPNDLAEHSETACNDEDFFSKAPSLGVLATDEPTFDWLIRAGDVDIGLLVLAFGV